MVKFPEFWLNKYDGNGSAQQVSLPSGVVGYNRTLAQRYMNVLSLPFFETYVAGTPEYATYLNAAYAKVISGRSGGLSLIQSLTRTQLAQANQPLTKLNDYGNETTDRHR